MRSSRPRAAAPRFVLGLDAMTPLTGSSANTALADWLCGALAAASRRERTEIGLHTSLWELALDSLSLVSIVAQVELVWGIELALEDVEAMLKSARVADILVVLERRAAKTAPNPGRKDGARIGGRSRDDPSARVWKDY